MPGEHEVGRPRRSAIGARLDRRPHAVIDGCGDEARGHRKPAEASGTDARDRPGRPVVVADRECGGVPAAQPVRRREPDDDARTGSGDPEVVDLRGIRDDPCLGPARRAPVRRVRPEVDVRVVDDLLEHGCVRPDRVQPGAGARQALAGRRPRTVLVVAPATRWARGGPAPTRACRRATGPSKGSHRSRAACAPSGRPGRRSEPARGPRGRARGSGPTRRRRPAHPSRPRARAPARASSRYRPARSDLPSPEPPDFARRPCLVRPRSRVWPILRPVPTPPSDGDRLTHRGLGVRLSSNSR